MNFPRERKERATMNLPEEILEKILSRLPTKSLLQLRCVCKTWRTLISHPLFVKTHLRFQQELPEIGLLYPRKSDHDLDLGSHLGISSENIVAILDSCHGLLCIVHRFHSDHFPKPLQELILWNPCTGQFNHIPSPVFVSYKSYWFCFFYDSDADDYKIVRILTLQTMDRTRVDVFSLKSNKWRTAVETHASVIASGSAIHFNGNIHWLASIDSSGGGRDIVAFSLRDEKFLEMKLPTQITFSTYLTVLGGRLHVGSLYFRETWGRKEYHDICLSGHEMWMMEEYGMKESWKRVASFPYRVRDDDDLNGILPFVLRVSDNGLLLVADGRNLVLCDSKNNTWKNITSYQRVGNYQKEVSLYIETLVSPCSG